MTKFVVSGIINSNLDEVSHLFYLDVVPGVEVHSHRRAGIRFHRFPGDRLLRKEVPHRLRTRCCFQGLLGSEDSQDRIPSWRLRRSAAGTRWSLASLEILATALAAAVG